MRTSHPPVAVLAGGPLDGYEERLRYADPPAVLVSPAFVATDPGLYVLGRSYRHDDGSACRANYRWSPGYHATCGLCDWLSGPQVEPQPAADLAVWHVYEEHPGVWRWLLGDRAPDCVDPRSAT